MSLNRASSLPGTGADDGDSSLECVDWTSLLPEPCRMLILERMDSITRAAWRVVSKQACQDVSVATKQLVWEGHSSRHGAPAPEDVDTPVVKSIRLSGLLSKLPSLQHLRSDFVEHLEGIQYVSSTLRSLHVNGGIQDLSPLQHCLVLEQLTLDARHYYPKSLADTLPAVMAALIPCLRRLHMCYIEGSAFERVMLRSVAPLTRLQQLKLFLPNLEPEDWIELAQPLSRMTDLWLLDLSRSNIGSAMSGLAPAIGQLQQLHTLQLDGCRLCSGDAPALAQAIMPLAALVTQLGMPSGSIRYGSHAAASTALVPAPQGPSATLVSLQLGCNDLGADGMAALAPAIQNCTALTELDLERNRCDGQGATALARALTVIALSLTSLTLSHNRIGCHGAAALAPALGAMTALQTLRFGYNKLGAEGVRALAPALQSMPLQILGIDLKDLEGAHLLASILKKMTTLRTVYVVELG